MLKNPRVEDIHDDWQEEQNKLAKVQMQ